MDSRIKELDKIRELDCEFIRTNRGGVAMISSYLVSNLIYSQRMKILVFEWRRNKIQYFEQY